MKKAILISGIIWGISCVLAAIVCFAFAGVAAMPEFLAEFKKANPSISEADAKATVEALTIVLAVSGSYSVIAAVLSFVLAGTRNSKSRGLGLGLGISSIVLGATLPAIFTLIDVGQNR